MGPYPGSPMGLPVPYEALKQPPSNFFAPIDYSLPPMGQMQVPYNYQNYTNNPYGKYISSVDGDAPLSAIRNRWNKIGIVKSLSTKDDQIMNLFGMIIAPGQDLYQYQVQDKNGFIIPLKITSELNSGDRIPFISGHEGAGTWVVDLNDVLILNCTS